MFLPSRSFSGWKRRCCFSAYFTPSPTLFPFVFACARPQRSGVLGPWPCRHPQTRLRPQLPWGRPRTSPRVPGDPQVPPPGFALREPWGRRGHPCDRRPPWGRGDPRKAPGCPAVTHPPPPVPPAGHLAGEGDEGGLDLRVVGVLEEVVGLEDVVGLHPVARDGPQEVPDVLQLRGGRVRACTLGHPPLPACRWDPAPLGNPLTLCQFWTGSFTFCTEPGCSLLMSLGGEGEGGRVRGSGRRGGGRGLGSGWG